MSIFDFKLEPSRFRKFCLLFLALSSCFGFCIGICTATLADYSVLSLMRIVASANVSIVQRILVTLLPFLIAAIAVLLSKTHLLYILVFFKSCFYAFCMYATCVEFSSAGWLMCMLLLLADGITMLVVLWFAIRHLAGFSRNTWIELSFFAYVCVGVCIADVTLVSPLLKSLSEH